MRSETAATVMVSVRQVKDLPRISWSKTSPVSTTVLYAPSDPRYNLTTKRAHLVRHCGALTREMYLFILDSLGSTELLLILGAALIFFGPRRLPQLSRQLGKSLAEFRRASDDFKRTWEREVNLDNLEKGVSDDPAS